MARSAEDKRRFWTVACSKRYHVRLLLHFWFIQKLDSCYLTSAAWLWGVRRIIVKIKLATTEEQIVQSVLSHSQTAGWDSNTGILCVPEYTLQYTTGPLRVQFLQVRHKYRIHRACTHGARWAGPTQALHFMPVTGPTRPQKSMFDGIVPLNISDVSSVIVQLLLFLNISLLPFLHER